MLRSGSQEENNPGAGESAEEKVGRLLLSERVRAKYRGRRPIGWKKSSGEETGPALWICWFGFVLFLLAEAGSLSFLVFHQSVTIVSPAVAAIGAHFIAVGCFMMGLFPLMPPNYRESRWVAAALVFGLSASLPVLGPVCVLILFRLLKKTGEKGGSRREPGWVLGSQVPDAELADYTSSGSRPDSMLQVMIGADSVARRNLMLATKRLPPNEAVPVLRAGLRDADEEVKLYAQGILSQLVERYEKRVADLKTELTEHPEDTVLMLRLAEQYAEIVELDLVMDRELQIFYLSSAIDLLQQVLAKEPGNDYVWVLLARYQLLVDRPQEALQSVERLRELGVSSELLEPVEVEALFQMRDWTTFRDRLEGGVLNPFCDPRLQHLGEYWLGQHDRLRSRISLAAERALPEERDD